MTQPLVRVLRLSGSPYRHQVFDQVSVTLCRMVTASRRGSPEQPLIQCELQILICKIDWYSQSETAEEARQLPHLSSYLPRWEVLKWGATYLRLIYQAFHLAGSTKFTKSNCMSELSYEELHGTGGTSPRHKEAASSAVFAIPLSSSKIQQPCIVPSCLLHWPLSPVQLQLQHHRVIMWSTRSGRPSQSSGRRGIGLTLALYCL